MNSLADHSRSQPQHSRSGPLAAASVAVVAWGIGPLFVKAIGLSGITVAIYRLWFAVPVMFTILTVTRGRVSVAIFKVAAPAGAMFAAEIGFGFSSFQYTSIANATIIGALSPLLVLVVAGRMFGDRIRRIDGLWFALALVGTMMVVVLGASARGQEQGWLGDLLATGSLLVWTVYFLYIKRKRADGVPAFAFMTAVITCGAVALTPYALVAAQPVTALHGTDWVWLFCLICGPGAMGHGLMTWATRFLNVNLTSLMTLAGPVVSTVGAAIFFSQRLTGGQLTGGLLVLVAIAMVLLGHRNTGIAPQPLDG